MKVKKTNASSPPTAPPTTAPTSVECELADCRGRCNAVWEAAPELCNEVEVEPEAVVVKTRLGMEARLANEGL